jgi:hypothetical protein
LRFNKELSNKKAPLFLLFFFHLTLFFPNVALVSVVPFTKARLLMLGAESAADLMDEALLDEETLRAAGLAPGFSPPPPPPS